MEKKDNLKTLYNRLKGQAVEGLPGDYEEFRSLLGGPGQAERFYTHFQKDRRTGGLTESPEEFVKMVADAGRTAGVPFRGEVSGGVKEQAGTGNEGNEQTAVPGFSGYKGGMLWAGVENGGFRPYSAAGTEGDTGGGAKVALPDLQELKERRERAEQEDGALVREWREREKHDLRMAGAGAVQAHQDSFYADNRERYARAKGGIERLNREIALHPETLAGRQAQAEDFAVKKREIAEARRKLGSVYGRDYIIRGGRNPSVVSLQTENQKELGYLNEAEKLYDDTQALLLAPNKYDDSSGWENWKKGGKDMLTNVDFWTGGLSEIARNFDVRGVYEKMRRNEKGEDLDSYLTKGERELFNAFMAFSTAQAERAGDLSVGYRIGQGTPEVVATALVSALTGGVAGAVSAGARKAMVKWVAKNMAKHLATKGGRLAVKAGTNVLSRGAEAVVKSAFSTGLYRDASRNAVKLKQDANGEVMVDERGIPEMEELGTAWRDAGRDAFIHHWADGSFKRMEQAVKKALPAGIRRDFREAFGNVAVSDPEQVFRKFIVNPLSGTAKSVLYDGVVTDAYEEWYESSLKKLAGDKQALQDGDLVEKVLMFTGTLLPKWMIKGGFSARKLVKAKQDYGLSREKVAGKLQELGIGEQDCARFLWRMDRASAAEVAAEVARLVNAVAVHDAGKAGELVSVCCEYNRRRLEFHLQDGALREFGGEAGDEGVKVQEQRQREAAAAGSGTGRDVPAGGGSSPQMPGRVKAQTAGLAQESASADDGAGRMSGGMSGSRKVAAFHRPGLGDVALPAGAGQQGADWQAIAEAAGEGLGSAREMLDLAGKVIREGRMVRNGKRRLTITKDGYQAEVRKDVRGGWQLSAFRPAGRRDTGEKGGGRAGVKDGGRPGAAVMPEEGKKITGGRVPLRREHSVEGLTEGVFSWTKLLLQPKAGESQAR